MVNIHVEPPTHTCDSILSCLSLLAQTNDLSDNDVGSWLFLRFQGERKSVFPSGGHIPLKYYIAWDLFITAKRLLIVLPTFCKAGYGPEDDPSQVAMLPSEADRTVRETHGCVAAGVHVTGTQRDVPRKNNSRDTDGDVTYSRSKRLSWKPLGWHMELQLSLRRSSSCEELLELQDVPSNVTSFQWRQFRKFTWKNHNTTIWTFLNWQNFETKEALDLN